jgi:uncharacterized membrane-anchored protein
MSGVYFGALRSVSVASTICVVALLIEVFDYLTFLGCVFVGLMVFISGFFTGNRPGIGAALITGFSAGMLVLLSIFVIYRLSVSSGDSELEYMTYTLFSLSVYLLIGLPVVTALVTFILERLGIKPHA